ncbi:MAG TPA: tRNA epoxyqueuosine(34) reductase QueG, partial [Candidatus Krumholzibacteria bacterium]|nr:tRNA epoxyqueuosine(34) reductase QueG [Candidatus Krumholzibacteria bacterium]
MSAAETHIKSLAHDVGFSLCGIARLAPDPHSDAIFSRWLRDGHHGDMRWLERHRPLREDAIHCGAENVTSQFIAVIRNFDDC